MKIVNAGLGRMLHICYKGVTRKLTLLIIRFQILITSGTSGLVETITDAVSIHSIKKALYARRLTEGGFGQVSILDHFIGVSTKHESYYYSSKS